MQKLGSYQAIIVLCLIISCVSVTAQNYEQVWAPEYAEAEIFIEKHQRTIAEVFHQTPFSERMAMAVVFPELIRYNTIKDLFETKALEMVYVNHGLKSIDFSIGHFQMKPSFAEAIERDLLSGNHTQNHFCKLPPITAIDLNAERSERLERLKSIKWQLMYLRAFMELMYTRFPELIEKPKEKQVELLAAAYNLGYQHTINEINNWKTVKAFPNGKKAWTQQYAYADIAVYFYRRAKLLTTNENKNQDVRNISFKTGQPQN